MSIDDQRLYRTAFHTLEEFERRVRELNELSDRAGRPHRRSPAPGTASLTQIPTDLAPRSGADEPWAGYRFADIRQITHSENDARLLRMDQQVYS
ncbi:hypothetical protein ABZU75_39005 [Streptosporangium sp. NPDC005286]|uniref:hypothetical protein n=1 Tax=Streptosporangium sp. NPDC005286 TaxID=3154463 RepID=UPI0033A70EC4